MNRVMLLKVGTRVRVTRPGFGMVGTIKRVLPHLGMYHVDGPSGIHPVKLRGYSIETLTDRRAH